MKSTGIVRKVDELGRIVLPMELRRTLGIEERDALEIFVDGDYIMLKRHEPDCIFCGSAVNVASVKGKNICSACLTELLERGVQLAGTQHNSPGMESGGATEREAD